jgi:hypothetical protein
LAAADFDPTLPVDRHERAQLQDIVESGSVDDVVGTLWQGEPGETSEVAQPGRWREASPPIGAGGPVVAVSWNDGPRVLVPSARPTGSDVLTALWATLPSATVPDQRVESVDNTEISVHVVALTYAALDQPKSDSLECPDFVKAACGLALGLGLTAGPLFPDLIVSRPRHAPRWLVALRVRSKRAVGPEPRRRTKSPFERCGLFRLS